MGLLSSKVKAGKKGSLSSEEDAAIGSDRVAVGVFINEKSTNCF